MAWDGVNFFSKLRMCEYPMLFCYITFTKKTYFGACSHILHNSGPSCNQAYALLLGTAGSETVWNIPVYPVYPIQFANVY